MIPPKQSLNDSNRAEANRSKENTNSSIHDALSDARDNESSKGLLPIAKLGVTSDVTNLLTLSIFDSATTHS